MRLIKPYFKFPTSSFKELDSIRKQCGPIFPKNYSLADFEVIKNERNPSAEGKHLTYYPNHTFNTGFDLTFGLVKASLAGNYIDLVCLRDMNNDLEGM